MSALLEPAVAGERGYTVVPDRRGLIALIVLVGVLAFSVRLGLQLRGGGLSGAGTYDDGVYFSGAAALVAGRLPYRDFLFLQPPGVMLVLAPFAALGRVIGDLRAFELARLVFMAIGAVNAMLVVLVLRRFLLGAAAVGGVFYAVFLAGAYAERSTTLEPVGTLGMLLALLALGAERRRPRLIAVLAGAALGLSIGMKIWYVVPAAVIVLLHRRRLWSALGAVAMTVLIYLPFFVAGPAVMWRELVTDQVGRPHTAGTSTGSRLASMLAVPGIGASRTPLHDAVILLLILAVAAATVIAATRPGARVFAALVVTGFAVVLASPSYFPHYAALVAAPIALCLGAASTRFGVPGGRRTRILVAGTLTATLLTTLVTGLTTHFRNGVDSRVPVAALQLGATRVTGCVTSDDPTFLIDMDVLSRDLEHGCALWPDVTGYTYDRDLVYAGGTHVGRVQNTRWQKDLLGYLTSGSAELAARSATGVSPATQAVLDRGAVLARSGRFVLRRTPG